MDASKITIAVCGDSFCAACIDDLVETNTGPRAHFSHQLEDRWGYRVLHLAHGGFGNLAIWFQIRHAILAKVNVIVYNRTWSHRVCVNMRDKFTMQQGLGNFRYYDPHNQSSHTPGTGDQSASLISTTPLNIENSPFFSISAEQKTAVDLYIKHLYCDSMQTEVDNWMFDYWHRNIQQAGILAVAFKQPGIGQCAYDFSQANPTFDTPFHTDRATQEQIAANIHNYVLDNVKKYL